jgi:hypothetical protein
LREPINVISIRVVQHTQQPDKIMTDVAETGNLPEPPIKEPEPEAPKAEPAKPKTSSLEDELAALLAGTAAIGDGVKEANKTASRVRRKSKEINASCEGMWESSQNKSGAADLWRMLGRNRRNSKDDSADLSDGALRKVWICPLFTLEGSAAPARVAGPHGSSFVLPPRTMLP